MREGNTLYGFPRPATHTLSRIDTGPFPFINRHYQRDEARRYAVLREKGVFDSELIHSIILDWYERVGTQVYAMEVDRWPESPCYCPPICNQGWKVCDDWSVYNTTPAFSFKEYEQSQAVKDALAQLQNHYAGGAPTWSGGSYGTLLSIRSCNRSHSSRLFSELLSSSRQAL